ncbi:Csr1 protein [Martiniozyma asiatica (nom. inval.)]|nr:Csr1 protein [Martiniozyma asiatica]
MSLNKFEPGRVQNLTNDQEHVLKQVWMYLLHFQGHQITPPGPLMKHASTVKGGSGSNEQPKKKGLLGRLKKNKKEDSDGHHKGLERSVTGQSGLDPNVKHSTDLSFHDALKGLEKDKISKTFQRALRHDFPDNLLLRFIRARKWDVDNSLLMIAKTLEWRENESHVDDLFCDGELECKRNKEEGVLIQYRKGKCIIRGRDKLNRPIVIVRPRFHLSSEQTSEQVEKFTLLLIESARLLLTEPVDQCVLIFDLNGFTMANMDYDPVKYITGAFEAHYPESLGVLLIHKAPWIFSGIWAIVKKWLDPVVASKINFTKSTEDLEKWISKDQLIEELGGNDKYTWEYLEPTDKDNSKNDDSEIRSKLEKERDELFKKFDQKTIEWIESRTVEQSKSLLKERLLIQSELSENYKKLDQYIRNRGIYDRLGYVTFI